MTTSNASWRSAFSVYAQPRVLGMIFPAFPPFSFPLGSLGYRQQKRFPVV